MSSLMNLESKIFQKHQERPNPAYPIDAYEYILRSVGRVVSKLQVRRHITAAELVQGLMGLAREDFGALAFRVLQYWNVQKPSDIGVMVFDLIDWKLLAKQDEDRLEDFNLPDSFETMLLKVSPFDESEAS